MIGTCTLLISWNTDFLGPLRYRVPFSLLMLVILMSGLLSLTGSAGTAEAIELLLTWGGAFWLSYLWGGRDLLCLQLLDRSSEDFQPIGRGAGAGSRCWLVNGSALKKLIKCGTGRRRVLLFRDSLAGWTKSQNTGFTTGWYLTTHIEISLDENSGPGPKETKSILPCFD